jgi:hypothetical protein
MECGDCWMCCRVPEVKEIGKSAGERCKNYVIGEGCKIYENRPEECRLFECSYFQMEKAFEGLRPDSCGIMFEKISDNVFFGSIETDLTEMAKKQIDAFIEQGFSVLVGYPNEKNLTLFLAENHTPNMVEKEYKEYIEKRNGSSNL